MNKVKKKKEKRKEEQVKMYKVKSFGIPPDTKTRRIGRKERRRPSSNWKLSIPHVLIL